MEDEQEAPRRPRRGRRLLLALLVLVVVALVGLWIERKPLATRYADRFLAAKGVPARYGIADLGFGRQRLVNVVLGDPAHPDLVADWLEARTAVGLRGPYLTGVRAGHVRVRARLVDGKLSFGSIDRLIPAGEAGKPFALPALALDVEDARVRLETPVGLIGAKLSGSGRLDGGFAGRLAVTSARLGGECAATMPRAVVQVTTRRNAVRVEGSGETAGAACGGVAAGYANVNGSGEIGLGRAVTWRVDADLAAQALRHPVARATRFAGRVVLAGGLSNARGTVTLTAHGVTGEGVAAETVTLAGAVRRDPAAATTLGYDGRLRWTRARWDAALRGFGAAGEGTPVGPLVRQVVAAVTGAARAFDGDVGLVAGIGAAGTSVTVADAALTAASGARAMLAAGEGSAAWTPAAGLRLAGVARLGGGGLPNATIRFAPGPGYRGTATVAPYVAGDARLALAPVRFAVVGGDVRLATTATVSGPLGDGRVEGLTTPVDLRWTGGALTLDPACAPVTWQRVAASGLVLDPGGVKLCPTGPALVTMRGGTLGGGASLGATRLTGRLGTTPLTLAATGARLRLSDRGFAIDGVAARLGSPERLTRLDIATLEGRASPAGLAGRFAGAGGQIGAVPLLLYDAAGEWRLAGGALTLGGALTVSDAQVSQPRFKSLPVRDVALTLANGQVAATGQVRAPGGTRSVADVRLTHALASGTGNARFTVPGLVFDKALQPDQLTPVTFGVIADVRGTVTGEGAIDWTAAGVTSTGSFTTQATDLAAAFGPVQGIAGTIRFTDLLALESAPGQTFTVASVNPGIAVTDGVVRFQTLASARVRVEGARWPFAGGTLTLEPTLLDFGQAVQRRMVFRVDAIAADQFLQQFDFKNLDATGVFDGVLPMVFDADGGRIVDGRLQVRPGGGTIAYVGPLGQKDIGFWPNLAFQALKSLRYRNLAIVMNGPLAGEMVTEVRFAGVSQGEGAARGGITGLLVRRLQRLPFLFNIRIQAPFRGLLDATASFYDPRRLIQRNLPQLLDEQNKRAGPPGAPAPIQPPESETVP